MQSELRPTGIPSSPHLLEGCWWYYWFLEAFLWWFLKRYHISLGFWRVNSVNLSRDWFGCFWWLLKCFDPFVLSRLSWTYLYVVCFFTPWFKFSNRLWTFVLIVLVTYFSWPLRMRLWTSLVFLPRSKTPQRRNCHTQTASRCSLYISLHFSQHQTRSCSYTPRENTQNPKKGEPPKKTVAQRTRF